MALHVSTLPLSDQIFTHIEPKSGKNTTIAATRLNEWCQKSNHPRVNIPLTRDGAELLWNKRGVEKDRLKRLTVLCRYYPILVLEWPDGTHLIADGTHSYCWQYSQGFSSAVAWMVPQVVWREFVVEGLPDASEEQLLSSFSGIRT